MHRDAHVDARSPRGPRAQRVEALEEHRHLGVAEAALPLVGRAPEAAAVVGGREQHDLEPLGDRSLRERDRHRVRLVVRRPVGLVDDIVKLADRAVAGSGHLRVHALADGAHRVGIVAAGEPVHLIAPAPEVIAGMWPFGHPAQVELERVAVRVRHRRHARASHRPSNLARASSRTNTGSPATNAANTGLWPKR